MSIYISSLTLVDSRSTPSWKSSLSSLGDAWIMTCHVSPCVFECVHVCRWFFFFSSADVLLLVPVFFSPPPLETIPCWETRNHFWDVYRQSHGRSWLTELINCPCFIKRWPCFYCHSCSCGGTEMEKLSWNRGEMVLWSWEKNIPFGKEEKKLTPVLSNNMNKRLRLKVWFGKRIVGGWLRNTDWRIQK